MPQSATRRSVRGYLPWLALAPKIYLDAGDLTTMRQERTGAAATTLCAADGDPVGSWLNKGTMSGWFTATADGKRPILRNRNGVWVLQFATASSQELEAPAKTFGNNVTGFSCVTAVECANTASNNGLFHCSIGTASSTRFQAFLSSGNKSSLSARRLDVDLGVAVNASTNYPTTPFVLGARWDITNTTAKVYENAAEVGSDVAFQTTGNTSATDNNIFPRLGSIGGSSYLDGYVGDVLAQDTLMSVDDLARVTGYMKAKFRVT